MDGRMDGWPGTKLTGQAETGSSLKRGRWMEEGEGGRGGQCTTMPPPRRHFKITRARLNTLARATSWRRKIAAYTAGWTDNFKSVVSIERGFYDTAKVTAWAVMMS